MSVLLERLSVELAAAAEREAHRSVRRRRRTRWTATAAVALLCSAGAAAATGTFFWQPQLGNESQGHPSASASDVPPEQLELFAVLRRPQSDADRGAAGRYAARWLGTEFRGVRTNSIRVLSNGAVLFSAEHGPSGENSLCLFLADTEAGGFTCPGSLDGLRRDGLAVITMPPPDIEFKTRSGKLVLRDGRPVPKPGSQNTPQPASVYGLAPDGVAAVRFDTTIVAVHENAYEAHLKPGESPQGTLLDSDGNPWRPR